MSALPTGILTFLFTDLEDSTALWDQEPEFAREALARHDALIEDVVAQHGGVVVRPRGEGDSRFIVFTHPTDAVLAAAAVQQALYAEDWSTPKPLKVRMGLHTGEADVRTGDYYGSTVNRCARLRSLASGGQILISRATAELVRDDLPHDLRLRDFGEHRLKGLSRPEHIFQLSVVGLPDDFPALKSLDAFPNNLPAQLTTFVGRERESADIKRLLGETHLLTLTGSGGTGKTRLAIENASDVLADYPDGIWLIELAPVADPAHVPGAVAEVMGVRQMEQRPLIQSIIDSIGSKQLLLILDNCEHVIEAAAQLTDALLRACPNLKILATSREPLGVAGETTWRVPSLDFPREVGADTIDNLTRFDSIRLFVDRARAARPDFMLTPANAAAVVQICRRLDGIPLAIELASTRIRALAVEQIAKRLDDRFRLLAGGSRTAMPRHQTLHALIDWSYDLLPEEECRLLRRLSVFVGGWTLEGAEAVCGEDDSDVFDLLLQLVNKSLVVVEDGEEERRYRLLETIRQYARDKLFDAGEAEEARNRHLNYYVQWIEDVDRQNRRQYMTKSWAAVIEAEHDNLRAALDWAIGSRQVKAALSVSANMYFFWYYRGYWIEGSQWTEAALETAEGTTSDEKLLAMLLLAILFSRMGREAEVETLVREADLQITQTSDVFIKGSYSLIKSLRSRNYEEARAYLENGIRTYREAGEHWGLAQGLYLLGDRARTHGDLDYAETLYNESLESAHVRDDWDSAAYAVGNLGRVALERGNYDQARSLFTQAIAHAREMGSRVGIADWLIQLATLTLIQRDYENTRKHLLENLLLCRDIGYRTEIGHNFVLAASLAIAQGQQERAARLLGAAETINTESEVYVEPETRARQADSAARLQAQLGDETYRRLFDWGHSLAMGEAIAFALQGLEA